MYNKYCLTCDNITSCFNVFLTWHEDKDIAYNNTTTPIAKQIDHGDRLLVQPLSYIQYVS